MRFIAVSSVLVLSAFLETLCAASTDHLEEKPHPNILTVKVSFISKIYLKTAVFPLQAP